eukprot:gene13326-4172_t
MKRRPVRSLFFLLVLFLAKDEFKVRSEKPNVNKCVGPHCQHQKDNKLPAVIKTLDLSFQGLPKVPRKVLEEHADTIEFLNLGENKIKKIEAGDFPYMEKLHTLRFEDNLMTRIPELNSALQLYELDMSYNHLTELEGSQLKTIHHLKTLDLSENPLTTMGPQSLVGPEKLRNLFLRGTKINSLPETGLKHLHRLNIKDIPNMWTVPEPSAFDALKEVDVTYSVHCCPFRGLVAAERKPSKVISCADYLASLKSAPSTPSPTYDDDFDDFDDFGDYGFFDNHDQNETTDASPQASHLRSSSSNVLDKLRGIEESFRMANTTFQPLCSNTNKTVKYVPPSRIVKCRPKPDAFNPCDDVIGTTVLRVFSWASSFLAIFGNIFLLLVLYCNESPLNVYKLLMYHLGIANTIMGFYLVILCSLDAFTYGRYYNFVRVWQYSGGCKVAGFLAVFSTELSVCVLAIVTIERYLLIVHALHIRRQMKVIHAKIALTIAWTYSFVVAILPVTDVISSYEKVAICLPFEASTDVSKGYVFWLLTFYLVTFVSVVLAYLRMYASVSGAPPCAGVNTEFKVAKRFSMIIFCNFGCWVPISIAGFLSFFSRLPMNIGVSKFLLVFAFPLNACTNPFLYAFFTKIFRGDVLKLLTKLGLRKKSSQKCQHQNPAYVRGRHGSRASEGTFATSAGNSRFSPPGTLKSTVNSNGKSPSHAYRQASNSSPVTFQNSAKSPPCCYRSISVESAENNTAAPTQNQAAGAAPPTERRTGIQRILHGLWALTIGRRNRNESTSSSKELLSSYDPERFNRIRSVSEAVEIACHDDHLLGENVYDVEKNSPPTDITNL